MPPTETTNRSAMSPRSLSLEVAMRAVGARLAPGLASVGVQVKKRRRALHKLVESKETYSARGE